MTSMCISLCVTAAYLSPVYTGAGFGEGIAGCQKSLAAVADRTHCVRGFAQPLKSSARWLKNIVGCCKRGASLVGRTPEIHSKLQAGRQSN